MILLVQMLINSLTDVKDQQLLNCEHIDVTCTALVDHVTQVSPTLICTVKLTTPTLRLHQKLMNVWPLRHVSLPSKRLHC